MKQVTSENKNRTETPEGAYKGICGLIYGYSLGFSVIFAILALLCSISVIGQMADGRPTSEDITRSEFYSYYLTVLFLAANYMRRIFGRLKRSDTPFKYDIADKMKGLGYLLCGGGIVGALLFLISNLLIDKLENNWFLDATAFGFVFMVVGLIFIAFALIFETGCKLQQESDETL